MKTIKFLLSVLSIILVLSCSKKDEITVLPSGENTAYYYLDGNLIIPTGFLAGTTNIPAITYGGCAPASSQALSLNNKIEKLTLFIKNGIQTVGKYNLNFGGVNSDCNNALNFASLTIRTTPNTDNLYTTIANTGEVIVTNLSPDKRKFSGTFKATLYSVNGEKKEITGGVFDINLDTL